MSEIEQEPTEETVQFRATINPPVENVEEFMEVPPPPPSEIAPDAPPQCCPMRTDFAFPPSPMAQMLPTILIGVGVAYLIGVATRAMVFRVPDLE